MDKLNGCFFLLKMKKNIILFGIVSADIKKELDSEAKKIFDCLQ